MRDFDTIVVGAGLAGLSCAIELANAGQRVLVLEADDVVGGRTSSWVEPDGMQVESGLHRVLGFYRAFPELLQKAGMKVDDVIVWEDEVEFRAPALVRARMVSTDARVAEHASGHVAV